MGPVTALISSASCRAIGVNMKVTPHRRHPHPCRADDDWILVHLGGSATLSGDAV